MSTFKRGDIARISDDLQFCTQFRGKVGRVVFAKWIKGHGTIYDVQVDKSIVRGILERDLRLEPYAPFRHDELGGKNCDDT